MHGADASDTYFKLNVKIVLARCSVCMKQGEAPHLLGLRLQDVTTHQRPPHVKMRLYHIAATVSHYGCASVWLPADERWDRMGSATQCSL